MEGEGATGILRIFNMIHGYLYYTIYDHCVIAWMGTWHKTSYQQFASKFYSFLLLLKISHLLLKRPNSSVPQHIANLPVGHTRLLLNQVDWNIPLFFLVLKNILEWYFEMTCNAIKNTIYSKSNAQLSPLRDFLIVCNLVLQPVDLWWRFSLPTGQNSSCQEMAKQNLMCCSMGTSGKWVQWFRVQRLIVRNHIENKGEESRKISPIVPVCVQTRTGRHFSISPKPIIFTP